MIQQSPLEIWLQIIGCLAGAIILAVMAYNLKLKEEEDLQKRKRHDRKH